MFCCPGLWLAGRPLPGQAHHAQVRSAHHRRCGVAPLRSCYRGAATLSGIWYDTEHIRKLCDVVLVGQACVAIVRFVQGLAFASVFTFIGTSAAHWGAVKEQLYFLTISFLALQVPGCCMTATLSICFSLPPSSAAAFQVFSSSRAISTGRSKDTRHFPFFSSSCGTFVRYPLNCNPPI